MKKRLALVIISLLLCTQIAKAYELDEGFGFEKAMLMRNDIQNSLKLTEEQLVLRNKVNEKYNPLFNEKFAEIGSKVNEIGKLANSQDCSKEKVDAIIQEFKVSENELFEINQNYEKEIRSILTQMQKMKYSILKSNSKRRLKKELKNQIKSIKNN